MNECSSSFCAEQHCRRDDRIPLFPTTTDSERNEVAITAEGRAYVKRARGGKSITARGKPF